MATGSYGITSPDRVGSRTTDRDQVSTKFSETSKRSGDTVAADPCRHSKDTRRHMVIASGHGGRNGFTDYSKHSEC